MTIKKKQLFIAGSLLAALLLAGILKGEEITFETTRILLEQANSKRAEILSPQNYQTGVKSWEKAQADSLAARSPDRLQKDLLEAQTSLKKAIETADLVNFSFPDLIAAYDDALKQNAPQRAPATYQQAQKSFEAIIERMEAGDLAKARPQVEEAQNLLRQAELEAIQADILGGARELQAQATANGNSDLVPESFTKAQEQLQAAEEFIRDHRYERENALQSAQEAEYLFRHAIYLSGWISSVKKDDKNWEKPILQFERQISGVSKQLHLDPKFDQGMELPLEAILAAIRSLQEDRTHLQEELADRDNQIGALEAEMGKLKAETGKYVAELESRRGEQEQQKKFQERVDQVRSLLLPEEGALLQVNDQIILRLSGLRFNSGSAEIRPENFPLLNKVQQAIRDFPDRHIEVQGHTDSQGDDKANLELSRRRAEAVRIYLLQNMNLTEDLITAAGLGENQPVASNDSASGRAQNRRIEIILKP